MKNPWAEKKRPRTAPDQDPSELMNGSNSMNNMNNLNMLNGSQPV